MYLLLFATKTSIIIIVYYDNFLLHSTTDSLQLDEGLETKEFFIDGFNDSKEIKAWSVELTVHPLGNISDLFLVKHAYLPDKMNLEDVQPDKFNRIYCS